jgi:hypothetical protein
MGQSATLYRVDKNIFENVTLSNIDHSAQKLAKEYVIFEKVFDGLVFVLSKNRSLKFAKLAKEIFYPPMLIGEEPIVTVENADSFDYSKFDFENLPIYYNNPANVDAINAMLDATTDELFLSNFNPDELNREGIYPCLWNRNEDEDSAFNENDIFEGFIKLKSFFKRAKADKDFILSYVG